MNARHGRWLLVGLLGAMTTGWAGVGGISTDFGLGFDSSYLFRGAKHGSFGLIGTARVTVPLGGGFDAVVGLNQYYQLGKPSGFGEGIYDFGAQYHPPVLGKFMVVEGGLTYYRMSNAYNPLLSFQGDNTQGRDTQELYFRTRFMLPLSPTFSIQQDIDHRASTYLMASANKSLTFGRQWDLNVMGSMGLQIGRGVDIYRDALVRANLGYKVAPFVKLNGVVDLAIPSHQVNPGAKGLAPAFTVSMSYAPPF